MISKTKRSYQNLSKLSSFFKMNDNDREKIRSNLSRLVLRTQWSDQLEMCLITKAVFKPKMLELQVKVSLF